MARRSLALALSCAFLVCSLACGSGGVEEPASGVAGRVLVGSCPVAGPGAPPCEAEGVSGVRLVVYDLEGDEVASGESGEGGTFEIRLAPGSYTLVAKDPPAPALDIEKPVEFRVEAGATTRLRVLLDTGARQASGEVSREALTLIRRCASVEAEAGEDGSQTFSSFPQESMGGREV